MNFLVISIALFYGLYIVFLYNSGFCTNVWLPCSEPCREGYKKEGLMCFKPCQASQKDQWLLCREKCREGYREILGVCHQKCPAGYKDIGATCASGGSCRTFWDKCKFRWPKALGGKCGGALVTRCDPIRFRKKNTYVPPTRAQESYAPALTLPPLLKTIVTFSGIMLAYAIYSLVKYLSGN